MIDGLWIRKDMSFLLHLSPVFAAFCDCDVRVLGFLVLVVLSVVQINTRTAVGIWTRCFFALVGLAVCVPHRISNPLASAKYCSVHDYNYEVHLIGS